MYYMNRARTYIYGTYKKEDLDIMIQEDPYLHWVPQIECIHVSVMLRRALSSLQGHPVPGPT